MSMPRVLIVEDDPGIGSMIARYLTGRGYACTCAVDAMEAERLLAASPTDIVVMDWMLPGRSGYELARALSTEAATQHIPIIMLTARAEEEDKIRALDMGVDDYLTKPFSLAELASRVNALLRRTASDASGSVVELAGLSIDRETRRITAVGKTISTGPTEFELLYFLMTHRERVYSRAELIHHVWNPRTRVEDRTVDVHVQRLRKALQPSGHDRLLQTVRGVGYRMSTRE